MLTDMTRHFIERMPLPQISLETALEPETPGIDIDDLPDGIVNGSSMLAFDPSIGPELRSSVALSLLAAQKVASADSVAITPDLWVQRHDMVLRGLNWFSVAGGDVVSNTKTTGASVHEAILPFLAAAFGPAAAAGAMIITALEQMSKMDEGTPWIRLFNRESRRFDVSEYRFATVEDVGNAVVLRLAAARFLAVKETIQVLFFKFRDVDVDFTVANSTLSANANLLEAMNGDLKAKLQAHTRGFIDALVL